VALSDDDLDTARRNLLACRDIATRTGYHNPTLWSWQAELVEVAAKLGEHALAREVSHQLDIDAASHGSKQANAIAARCRGIVANDMTTIHDAFEESLGHLDSLPVPFECARTQFLYGEQLLEHGNRTDAEQQLSGALEAFDQIGAHPWSARARAQLAPTEAALHTTVFQHLTERELQIAVAVSTGKTSAETASALFLSRRTVEHHLAAMYRKLHIRNRTELAALLHDPNAVPSARKTDTVS
jgi:DNA-binding CsgD family transcriptional regulator